MLSMSVQANINASIIKPSISVASKPFRASSSLSLKPRTSISHSKLTLSRRLTRKLDLSASVSAFPAGDALAEDALAEDEDIVSESEEETVNEEEEEEDDEEEEEQEEEEEKELLEVDVDTVTKPRLVLKFIWMEKNIGIGLDQQLPDYGTVPLSPYYFWPRKDAWDELKVLLENKPWVSQKQMVLLLNQATDIINLWQQGGGKLTSAQSS